jgi:RND superfamily putative drug exporter
MVTRVREALADGAPNVADAVTQALCTTGRAILISGVTIAASLCGLLLAGVGFLGSLAAGAIGATLLALAAALTLAPAALVVLDGRLERLPIRSSASAIRSRLFWQTLAEAVVRRRLLIVCLFVPVLIALSLPALGLNVKFRTFGMLPKDDPVRRATSEVERAFGPGFGAPVTILAKTSGAHLEAAAERERGIAQIGVAQNGSGGWRRLSAILRAAPDTDRAEDLMHGLRARLPTLLGRDTLIGGPTAEAADLADRINTRTPLVAIAIMLAEIAFLTVAFRAPVLAVKAALTTLLSVTATLGILSLLFGGSDALAYFVPLLLVATLFGLSTDYEVFLLSRVREQHDAGDDNVSSVQTALVRSARSITLAGITMSVVFFAFASSPLLAFRQLGVGMGLAVLLDVTVVRGLVVPATVALLGELNWWRPRLRRRRPADSIAT